MEKRYWLRGLVWGLVFDIFFYFTIMYVIVRAQPFSKYENIFEFSWSLVQALFTDSLGAGFVQISMAVSLITSGVVGMFVGFIYGRIKSIHHTLPTKN